MRDFLDGILEFIGSESLTDLEFEAVVSTDPSYTKANYDELLTILEGREEVSGQAQKLNYYFLSKGVDLSAASALPTAKSNIYIGSDLG